MKLILLSNPFIIIIQDYGILILQGIGVTLLLSIVGTLIGLIFALVLGTIRIQTVQEYDSKFIRFIKRTGVLIVKIYVTVIRGTPMIVQAAIFYYGFFRIGLKWSPLVAGLFTVSINTTAYLTEVIRGSLQSVPKGQMEAARAIGMSQWKALRFIIFPQALKNAMASIGNELIINIKDTAVLDTIMVVDLYSATNAAANSTYFYFEAMLIAAAIYLILTLVSSRILTRIEKRLGAPSKALTSSN